MSLECAGEIKVMFDWRKKAALWKDDYNVQHQRRVSSGVSVSWVQSKHDLILSEEGKETDEFDVTVTAITITGLFSCRETTSWCVGQYQNAHVNVWVVNLHVCKLKSGRTSTSKHVVVCVQGRSPGVSLHETIMWWFNMSDA